MSSALLVQVQPLESIFYPVNPKNLFAGTSGAVITPTKPCPPPPTPKVLFGSGDMKTHAVSGIYIPTSLLDNPTKNPKPTGPKTLLQGAKIRKRIDVTVEQLRKYSEVVNVLKVSQQQILETNLDELNLRYVLDWGSGLQLQHSGYLQDLMNLSTAIALVESKTKLGQLVQSMGELDVQDATKDSWFKSKEKKVQAFMEKLKELQRVSRELRPDWLLSLHEEGMEVKKRLGELKTQLDPFIVTCSFFSEYDKDGFPKELYLTRLSSLLGTKASIGNDIATLDAILSTYVTVIETINSIVRNELPMWISNLSSVLSGNAADLTSLQTTKNNILTKLKQTL